MSKNTFVQVRFQTSSTAAKTVNHDLRKSKVSYLRDDMYHNQWQNIYYDYDDVEVKERMRKSYNEYNKLYKEKNGRNLQSGKQSDLLMGIITVSPIVNDWLEDGTINKKDLEKAFENSFKQIMKKINDFFECEIEIFSMSIHYDEKTPHFHFNIANHTDDGLPVWHNMRRAKNMLSEFQDLLEVEFQNQNINLNRGIKKSGATHKNIRQMHEQEIKELQKDLQSKVKDIQSSKKEIKLLDITSQEKKQQLDLLDIQLKQIRENIKKLKNKDDLKIEYDVQQILKESKKLLGYDSEKLVNNITKKLKEYSQIEEKTKREEQLEEDYEALEDAATDLQFRYNKLVNKLDDIEQEVTTLRETEQLLINDNEELKEENNQLKEDISLLEKDFKFNYREWKENRKSKFDEMRDRRDRNRR